MGLAGGAGASQSARSGQTVVGDETKQLIVAVGANWNASAVTMAKFSRSKTGWVQVGPSWPAKIGARGMSWGLGHHPSIPPDGVKLKAEGDKQAPAGVFRLGMTFGFAKNPPPKMKMPYSQATAFDLLVEDPKSPAYNTWVRLDHEAATEWEKANALILDDPAHELKIFVEHNTNPKPISGAGSAILLHIWRTNGFTSGCTAMDRSVLFELATWLDPTKEPRFVLLPQSVYTAVAKDWGLPSKPPSQTTHQTNHEEAITTCVLFE